MHKIWPAIVVRGRAVARLHVDQDIRSVKMLPTQAIARSCHTLLAHRAAEITDCAGKPDLCMNADSARALFWLITALVISCDPWLELFRLATLL